MSTYIDTISFWDDIFINEQPKKCIESIKIHRDLDNALYWLSNESKAILDYGCGSGAMLLKCALNRNVSKCLGIDISQKAVDLGRETAILNDLEDKVEFDCGEISSLEKVKANSFDGAILSNIIDNVTPNDAIDIIKNMRRIIIPKGKILIKLNPYLKQEQLDEYELKLIEDNLYLEKEGIYLRNLTTDQWKEFMEEFFSIKEYQEIYYEEFSQYNRLFLLTNDKEDS